MRFEGEREAGEPIAGGGSRQEGDGAEKTPRPLPAGPMGSSRGHESMDKGVRRTGTAGRIVRRQPETSGNAQPPTRPTSRQGPNPTLRDRPLVRECLYRMESGRYAACAGHGRAGASWADHSFADRKTCLSHPRNHGRFRSTTFDAIERGGPFFRGSRVTSLTERIREMDEPDQEVPVRNRYPLEERDHDDGG